MWISVKATTRARKAIKIITKMYGILWSGINRNTEFILTATVEYIHRDVLCVLGILSTHRATPWCQPHYLCHITGIVRGEESRMLHHAILHSLFIYHPHLLFSWDCYKILNQKMRYYVTNLHSWKESTNYKSMCTEKKKEVLDRGYYWGYSYDSIAQSSQQQQYPLKYSLSLLFWVQFMYCWNWYKVSCL